MKKNIKLLATFVVATIISSQAAAADGTVKFNGTITDASCQTHIGSVTGGSNETVNLGTVPSSSFSGVGSTAAEGAGSTNVKIYLTECPAGTPTTASLKFDGAYYKGDNSYLALDPASTASGVAILLSNPSGTALKLGEASEPFTLNVGTGSSTELNFKAAYIQRESTIVAGTANSSATFTINY
ncbi:fimbrial protein [Leclercia barmai]|uniref:fimbrial protein n=1 Tax=Leclercia TaxID=83654 RepID=UPI00057AF65B|nr:fimbrial protein [Leclercia adecarboxylata]